MESLRHHSKNSPKHTAVANGIAQQKSQKTTFQLLDNRPATVIQQKKWQQTTSSQNSKITTSNAIQLVKKYEKKKKKKVTKSGYESDSEDWVPSSARRKHRQTFSKKLRREVIMRGALRNKNRMYVCPGCGRPLADRKGREIKTFFISKSKKRHNIVSAQLDHYPPWAGRLKKLKAKKKSDEEIRKDHDDPTRLRPLCRECNQSHKFENVKELPDSGYTDDEYESDNEARDKEIWKKYRKDDDDNAGTGGSGITA
ncbi:hypothetical protein C8N46_101293 [Kordia periserrulae]|uniref:HNH endonuclease n=1 Tax=Kordia periserrulae TaxID=701523 RepID=A0A2T6C5T2_9FLAO|nr:hypothetical protein [Kordia periserrulae]PTX63689.1 hypothetical protein C8N46_101293 [Kordia periserrulae]